MSAIFKKELKSYFSNPIGYIILALYFLISGYNFVYYFSVGAPDAATYSIVSSYLLFLIVPPLLTMRMISEDRRQKIDQALFTAPVSLTKIVLGKFLAALALFCMCNIIYIIYEIIISTYVAVNWLAFLNTLFVFVLMGAALISIGLFVSSLTESPIVAFIVSFAATMAVLFFDSIAGMLKLEWLATAGESISFLSRFQDSASSVFNASDIVFFGSFIAFFLFLTVSSLEKKRWS